MLQECLRSGTFIDVSAFGVSTVRSLRIAICPDSSKECHRRSALTRIPASPLGLASAWLTLLDQNLSSALLRSDHSENRQTSVAFVEILLEICHWPLFIPSCGLHRWTSLRSVRGQGRKICPPIRLFPLKFSCKPITSSALSEFLVSKGVVSEGLPG